ncbi:MAG: DUF4988 domain-containing protein [Burkholderiaceae bacterium]|nr:DUF4988 domain-containing protein [Burkholderiaceae bacterium]
MDLDDRLAALEKRIAHLEEAVGAINARGLPEQIAGIRQQVRDLIAAAAAFAPRVDG